MNIFKHKGHCGPEEKKIPFVFKSQDCHDD